MLRQAGRHLWQTARQCSCGELGGWRESARLPAAAVLDVRRGLAADPKPGESLHSLEA